jgi:hypothetical protein
MIGVELLRIVLTRAVVMIPDLRSAKAAACADSIVVPIV